MAALAHIGAASATAPPDDGTGRAPPTQPTSAPSSPRSALAAELRESADRVSTARVKAEFEHTLLSCLLFNVLYVYYIDHRLIVLLIRFSQIFRLLYFPHEPPEHQRITSVLLMMSNIAIALIHGAIVLEGTVGEMLLINFIGPEPHALAKLFYVDVVVVLLQFALMGIGSDGTGIVTGIPVAVGTPFIEVASPAADDEDRPSESSAQGGSEPQASQFSISDDVEGDTPREGADAGDEGNHLLQT